MSHVVLLGDSIFDNARYVPDRPPVIEQVRRGLPLGWQATLVAVDGHTVEDIALQMARIPAGTSHLVLSIGGNDALGAGSLLHQPTDTVGEALALLGEALAEFRDQYGSMLRSVLAVGLPLAVCTIYDAIPTLTGPERVGLAGFNEVILRAAIAAGLPVIDLRLICGQPDDYSPL